MKIDRNIMKRELIASHNRGEWTPELTDIMFQLAKGVAHHHIYKCVDDKEDMIQDGVTHLLMIWHKYDSSHISGNPFGYFTQSLFRHYTKYFSKTIKRNKRIMLMEDMNDIMMYDSSYEDKYE